MLSFAAKYGHNIHSQNGEDGILAECVKRLEIEEGHCVEIGANDGLWMSNTHALIDSGWSGLMVEADYSLYERCRDNWKHNPSVRVQCCKVDEQSVNIFVDDRCDVLSTDTDGFDYEIFKELKAKPKIVIVEIDSSIPPDRNEFNADGGAGYHPMVALARKKGYFVVAHTGNLVLADERYWSSHFPEITAHPLLHSELYFNSAWLKAA